MVLWLLLLVACCLACFWDRGSLCSQLWPETQILLMNPWVTVTNHHTWLYFSYTFKFQMLEMTLGSEGIFDRSYQFKELIQTLSEPTLQNLVKTTGSWACLPTRLCSATLPGLKTICHVFIFVVTTIANFHIPLTICSLGRWTAKLIFPSPIQTRLLTPQSTSFLYVHWNVKNLLRSLSLGTFNNTQSICSHLQYIKGNL